MEATRGMILMSAHDSDVSLYSIFPFMLMGLFVTCNGLEFSTLIPVKLWD